MAFLHYAYTFDSIAFHAELRAAVAPEGELDLYKLQSLARSVVGNGSEELKRTLNIINCDDGWLDDADGDASQAYLWYMVCLANVFHSGSSLSNRYQGNHWVLERILAAAGWKSNEVIELVLGDHRLDKLVEDSEYRFFADELSLCGGAINRKRIPSVLSHLRESAPYFSLESLETHRIVEESKTYNVPDADTIPSRAFQDAVDMLQTAIDRNEDLYLYRNP